MTGAPTNRRQRTASFPLGVPPAARLPAAPVHGLVLARWLARPAGGAQPPVRAAALTGAYLGRVIARDVRQLGLDRLLRLEERLPGRATAGARRLLGRAPRG